jgi:tRNA threonylcarbamoyladenosine biosynthesis protein TsaE
MHFEVALDKLEAFAKDFWELARGAKQFALIGEMGAGKTTIIAALCKFKGVVDPIGSPTFSIINQYNYIENNELQQIYHIDLYRLKDEEEIIQTGVEDCMYSGSVCMVEWPQKAPYLFDEKSITVFITAINESTRSVKIELPQNSIREQS